MDMGGLGHPHETDGDFFRAHNMNEEDTKGMSDAELHPSTRSSNGGNGGSGMSMPGWANKRNAKLAGMGLVAGAAVGVVIVPFLTKRRIISKTKSWQVAAASVAIATPLVVAYA